MSPVASRPGVEQGPSSVLPTSAWAGERATAEIRPARTRRNATMAVSALASCAVLAALLWRLDIDAAASAAAHVSWVALAAAMLLNIPCTLLRARRSQLLLAQLGGRVPLTRMVTTQLGGQALSWLTPAASGDLVRPYMWRRSDGIPVRDGVSVVVYERVVSFVLLCAAGAVLASLLVPLGGWAIPLIISGALLLGALAYLGVRSRRHVARPGGRFSERVRAVIARFGELVTAPRLAARFTAITLAVFVLSGLQIVLLCAGIGSTLPLWVAVAAYCLSQAAGSLSSLPFGLGVTDAVVVGLLVAAGLDVPAATATMLLTRVAVTLPLALAGAGAYLVIGRGLDRREVAR